IMLEDNKDQLIINNNTQKGRVKIDWGRQGGVLLAYAIVLLGYYGIVANIVMVNKYGEYFSFTEMDRTILFWTFKTYLETFYLPIILVFLTCFFLTYKEDIPHYGIKASIWLVPSIIFEAFIFYWIMFGFSIEPFIWQFGDWKGYIHILILFAISISGALCGMKIKQVIISRKKIS
ncbi:MAG: hypothetical protein ACFFDH_08820, partial [Promethearchaeota archaeon]